MLRMLIVAAVAAWAAGQAWAEDEPAAKPAKDKPAKAKGAPAQVATPAEVAPRTEPVLTETAVDIKTPIWTADLPAGQKPQVEWVRAVWGRSDEKAYGNWEKKAPWGGVKVWYVTHPRIAFFKGKMIATFIERNLPHAYGDTVIHVMASDKDCREWQTVAHFECQGVRSSDRQVDAARLATQPALGKTMSGWISSGLTATQFCLTTDGRLMLTGRSGRENGRMMASFSEDGLKWTPLKPFTEAAKGKGQIGQIFKLAWSKGRAYGLSRGGGLWTSPDGLSYEQISVKTPADGRVGNNETASAFAGEKWYVFQRSGQVISADPPYTDWEINKTNVKGPHSHGGPDLISLPDGQVIAGSRGEIEGFGKSLAVVFAYDGKLLKPMTAFHSGATMSGYPGLTWAEGSLYVSFLQDRPGKDATDTKRGQFCLAKIAWPEKK